MIYVIDLLDEIRQRLDDTGGNLDPITTGITPFAAWQRAEVESSLVWNNSYLCRCLNWAIREIAVRTGGIDDNTTTLRLRQALSSPRRPAGRCKIYELPMLA